MHAILKKYAYFSEIGCILITIYLYILTWKSKKEPVINRKFTLNGKEIDSEFGHFVIVKENNIQ